MMGPTPFRDIWVMAELELREMLRTRRILLVLVLYLFGALVASLFFVEFIGQLETAAASALGTTAAGRPGALTQQLLKEPSYRNIFGNLFKGSGDVEQLIQIPAISLFFGWSSINFVPLLIMLTTTDTVVQELQSRGMRFLIFRTGRLEIVAGKALGQALLLTLVTALTALVYAAVAWYQLYGFELVPTLSGMLFFWPRILTYGLTYLSLGVSISCVTSSVNMARGIALLSLLFVGILNRLIIFRQNLSPSIFLDFLQFLLPPSHKDMLWHTDWTLVAGTLLTLLALAGLYLAAGIWYFARRDI